MPPQESNRARQAFEDYYALGPGRSLPLLEQKYRKRTKPVPPTRQLSRLKRWSTDYGWQERIAERDKAINAAAQSELEAERTAILVSGFALQHERIRALNEVAALLQKELLNKNKRWLADAKWIGGFETGQQVDLERFNSAIIEQFRGTLDDIAIELGERAKGVKLTGKDGGPIALAITEVVVELPKAG